jgi:hypothetical protein
MDSDFTFSTNGFKRPPVYPGISPLRDRKRRASRENAQNVDTSVSGPVRYDVKLRK